MRLKYKWKLQSFLIIILAYVFLLILFIDKIKEGIKSGLDIESAVDEAVDWAIHNGVLSEYLSLHKSEVVGMILTEYDEKKVMETIGERSE